MSQSLAVLEQRGQRDEGHPQPLLLVGQRLIQSTFRADLCTEHWLCGSLKAPCLEEEVSEHKPRTRSVLRAGMESGAGKRCRSSFWLQLIPVSLLCHICLSFSTLSSRRSETKSVPFPLCPRCLEERQAGNRGSIELNASSKGRREGQETEEGWGKESLCLPKECAEGSTESIVLRPRHVG